jgi:DNA-binding YbaB/EbfC family protein
MANVFGQMKDLYKMQKEAKQMQKKMEKIKVTGESKDGKVRMYFNGAQELEDMTIDSSLLDSENQQKVVDGIKQAYKDFQKKLQKKMMGNFDMDQLKNMMGGR